ncbi:MAG: hypothetical protein RSC93_14480, partial [Erysipelotrichaceae bacterium]
LCFLELAFKIVDEIGNRVAVLIDLYQRAMLFFLDLLFLFPHFVSCYFLCHRFKIFPNIEHSEMFCFPLAFSGSLWQSKAL